MGDAVLDMSEVKVARVIEDAEPALRLLAARNTGPGPSGTHTDREPDRGVHLDGGAGRAPNWPRLWNPSCWVSGWR